MANEYRVTKLGLEVLGSAVNPNVQVAAFGIEVVRSIAGNTATNVQVASFGIEVMRSISLITPPSSGGGSRRMQIIS